jgi:hypothetical protein
MAGDLSGNVLFAFENRKYKAGGLLPKRFSPTAASSIAGVMFRRSIACLTGRNVE